MTRTSFDVVIIGAGPGGLQCAAELEKADKSVLILEKNRLIGPKICAGGMRTSDCVRLSIPEEEYGSDIDSFGYTTIDRTCLGKHQYGRLPRKERHSNRGSGY